MNTADITRHTLAKRLRSQGPDAAARLAKAMRIPSAKLDDFMRKPDGNALTADQVEIVAGWCRGEFGVMATGDGEGTLKLMKLKRGENRIMGVKADRAPVGAYGDPYGDPVDNPHRPPGPAPSSTLPSKTHREIPTTTDEAREAAKRADEEAAKPKKTSTFMPLWGGNKGT